MTTLIREYAPLCLARDPGWGRVNEVRRGSAADVTMLVNGGGVNRTRTRAG
jgi:hypothetical protein